MPTKCARSTELKLHLTHALTHKQECFKVYLKTHASESERQEHHFFILGFNYYFMYVIKSRLYYTFLQCGSISS